MAFRAQIGGKCDTIGRNVGCADAVEARGQRGQREERGGGLGWAIIIRFAMGKQKYDRLVTA